MDSEQHRRISEKIPGNFELKKLYDSHLELKEKIHRYSRQPHLTAQQYDEMVTLKAEKLRGVERMLKMIKR